MSEFTAAPIGCLIMAAGNASRFGENKLTASFAGKSLFSLALAAIPADTFARVTVVSQYPALLQIIRHCRPSIRHLKALKYC